MTVYEMLHCFLTRICFCSFSLFLSIHRYLSVCSRLALKAHTTERALEVVFADTPLHGELDALYCYALACLDFPFRARVDALTVSVTGMPPLDRTKGLAFCCDWSSCNGIILLRTHTQGRTTRWLGMIVYSLSVSLSDLTSD